MINFNHYRSILCLDGTLPAASFFQNPLPVIAADGAANTLMQMGIKPHIVIGDLDSIEPALMDKINTHYHYDQDFCDYEKSLQYLHEHQLLPCIILGMNGGYLDHILNNINIFMKFNNVFYAPPLYGFALQEMEQQIFTLPLNTKISLFGIPAATVSTHGLQWELSHASLAFPGNNSCFNRNVKENVEIMVAEGSALILIYQ